MTCVDSSSSTCRLPSLLRQGLPRRLSEPDLSVGIALRIQTQGSLPGWQPYGQALVTDGGLHPDGSVVRLPLRRTEVLTEDRCPPARGRGGCRGRVAP